VESRGTADPAQVAKRLRLWTTGCPDVENLSTFPGNWGGKRDRNVLYACMHVLTCMYIFIQHMCICCLLLGTIGDGLMSIVSTDTVGFLIAK
jgi:hypothetical protein